MAARRTESESYKINQHLDFKVNAGQIYDCVIPITRCVICMIEFNVGDSVRYLPCMHTYHVEVILRS